MSRQFRRGNQLRQQSQYNNQDLMNSRSDQYSYSPAQSSAGGFSDRDGGYGHSGGGYSGGGGYSSGGHSGGGGYSGGGHSGGGYSPSPSYGHSSPSYSSGSVYGSHSGYGKMDCPGIPIALLLITLLGVAVMGFILYTKIVGAGRRKRSSGDRYPDLEEISNILLIGLEEFEEKIDKIAEGQDGGDDNWISKIYNQFSFFNDVDNQLTESDMDGLEPPILDETWGLGIRNGSIIKNVTANATIEEPIKLNYEENSKKKRSVEEEIEEEEVEDTEEKCRVDMWRCLSKVIEGGLHYIDDPDGLMGLAKKTMFKIAFHGGFSNVWSGVMTIPEARHIKQCMNDHSECVSYEILRREAQETMDPSDPAYDMYRKKKTPKGEEEKPEKKEEKKPKRERLIINPEFVESMDQGDGSVQYDEDYKIENNEV